MIFLTAGHLPVAMKWYWALFGLASAALAQPRPGFSVDVNLVQVPCVVRDAKGGPAAGLRREDFTVFEDGRRRDIKYLWQEADLPLTLGLVVDVSGTQVRFIQEHQQAVLQFLKQVLSERDRAFLVAVEIQQRLVTDLTNSIERLREGTGALSSGKAEILGEPCSSSVHRILFMPVMLPCTSPIWNGVFFAARLKLRSQPGRKAIVLLTDGWDMGSNHGISDAIEACQSADTIVYSIRYSAFLPNTALPARQARRAKRDLERLSKETGGRIYDGELENVSTIFKSIETELRMQYVIGYTHPEAPKRGYHSVKVTVNRPGFVVRARKRYYAE
jgi:VWFA-related protein